MTNHFINSFCVAIIALVSFSSCSEFDNSSSNSSIIESTQEKQTEDESEEILSSEIDKHEATSILPDSSTISQFDSTQEETTEKETIEELSSNETDDEIITESGSEGINDNSLLFIGSYANSPIEWIILETDENKSLLISKYILDYKAFNDTTMATATDWENSSIRNWLNNDFFYSSFDEHEQNAIQFTTVQDYKADKKLGSQTNDRVFLLSYDQAFTYFETDEARITEATSYAIQQKKFASNSWWLINSYIDDLYKYLVNPKGVIDNCPRVNEEEGIRPALWISNDYILK